MIVVKMYVFCVHSRMVVRRLLFEVVLCKYNLCKAELPLLYICLALFNKRYGDLKVGYEWHGKYPISFFGLSCPKSNVYICILKR